MRIRGTKQVVSSFLLVTTTFFFLWLYLRPGSTTPKQPYLSSSYDDALPEEGERQEEEREMDTPSTTDAAVTTTSKSSLVYSPDGVRHWKTIGPAEDPRVNLLTSPYYSRNMRRRQTRKYDPEGEPKVILWFASKTLRISRDMTSMFRKCPVSTCVVSPLKTIAKQASAVVYDDDKMARYEPLPPIEGRVLVYYTMKTPNDVVSDGKQHYPTQNVSWSSAINWVWSYRPDSDIFEPFGYFQPSGISITDDINMIMRKKSSVALWITPQVKAGRKVDGEKSMHEGPSHNDVEAYLEGMEGTLTYDTMTLTDLKEALRDRSFTLSKYYFIFVFEWVDCPNYVSDLYFLSLDKRVHAVPVVRGGFPYAKYLPTETFINADDFEGPEDLAMYLTKLAVPGKKPYTEMLKKKCKYSWEDGSNHAWCQLCDLVHHAQEDEGLMDRIDDVHAWFVEGAQCKAGNAHERKKRMRMAKESARKATSTADEKRSPNVGTMSTHSRGSRAGTGSTGRAANRPVGTRYTRP